MELTREPLNPAWISALAAIFGSIVGALGSGLSSWIAQRFQERREFLTKRVAQREQLYSDFITESAKAMLDAYPRTHFSVGFV